MTQISRYLAQLSRIDQKLNDLGANLEDSFHDQDQEAMEAGSCPRAKEVLAKAFW